MEKIILLVTAIAGVLLCFKFKGIFHKILALGLASSFMLTWMGDRQILSWSILLLLLLAILTSSYGLAVKELDIFERISIITIGLFFTLGTIFKIMHWNGGAMLRLALILPVMTYIISLFINKRVVTKEISFMGVWVVLAIFELLKIFFPR